MHRWWEEREYTRERETWRCGGLRTCPSGDGDDRPVLLHFMCNEYRAERESEMKARLGLQRIES